MRIKLQSYTTKTHYFNWISLTMNWFKTKRCTSLPSFGSSSKHIQSEVSRWQISFSWASVLHKVHKLSLPKLTSAWLSLPVAYWKAWNASSFSFSGSTYSILGLALIREGGGKSERRILEIEKDKSRAMTKYLVSLTQQLLPLPVMQFCQCGKRGHVWAYRVSRTWIFWVISSYNKFWRTAFPSLPRSRFFGLSRNAPRDSPKNGCEGDYAFPCQIDGILGFISAYRRLHSNWPKTAVKISWFCTNRNQKSAT